MTDNNAANLILRHRAVQHETETHQDPGQPGGGEDEQAEERQTRVRVAAAPDVDERAAEAGAEEGHAEQGRQQ